MFNNLGLRPAGYIDGQCFPAELGRAQLHSFVCASGIVGDPLDLGSSFSLNVSETSRDMVVINPGSAYVGEPDGAGGFKGMYFLHSADPIELGMGDFVPLPPSTRVYFWLEVFPSGWNVLHGLDGFPAPSEGRTTLNLFSTSRLSSVSDAWVYGVQDWRTTYDLCAAKGDPGDPGPANSLAIGTVNTLPPGQPASASVTGTAPSQTLNLGLPVAEPAPGIPGPANSLAIGTVNTLPPGQPASASVTGTAPSQTLNLGLPVAEPAAPIVLSSMWGLAASAYIETGSPYTFDTQQILDNFPDAEEFAIVAYSRPQDGSDSDDDWIGLPGLGSSMVAAVANRALFELQFGGSSDLTVTLSPSNGGSTSTLLLESGQDPILRMVTRQEGARGERGSVGFGNQFPYHVMQIQGGWVGSSFFSVDSSSRIPAFSLQADPLPAVPISVDGLPSAAASPFSLISNGQRGGNSGGRWTAPGMDPSGQTIRSAQTGTSFARVFVLIRRPL